MRVLTKLAFLPYGLYLVSHSQEKEIETKTGKYIRTIPTLPDKARKIVLGMADLILFCDLQVSTDESGKSVLRRVMRTKPNLYYEAGDRTGRLPETIDMNFQVFLEAFRRPAEPIPAGSKSLPDGSGRKSASAGK